MCTGQHVSSSSCVFCPAMASSTSSTCTQPTCVISAPPSVSRPPLETGDDSEFEVDGGTTVSSRCDYLPGKSFKRKRVSVDTDESDSDFFVDPPAATPTKKVARKQRKVEKVEAEDSSLTAARVLADAISTMQKELQASNQQFVAGIPQQQQQHTQTLQQTLMQSQMEFNAKLTPPSSTTPRWPRKCSTARTHIRDDIHLGHPCVGTQWKGAAEGDSSDGTKRRHSD